MVMVLTILAWNAADIGSNLLCTFYLTTFLSAIVQKWLQVEFLLVSASGGWREYSLRTLLEKFEKVAWFSLYIPIL